MTLGLLHWLAAFVLVGCSALGLDEYEQIQCAPDNTDGSPECDALNAELPAGSCARFYCSPTGLGCVYEERTSEEVSDGLDNDCNLAIDEDAPPPDQGARRMTRPLEGFLNMSPAVAEDGTLHVVLTHESEDDFALSHLTVGDSIDPPQDTLISNDCLGGADAAPQSCRIKDLAVAVTSSTMVAAGFHRSTCGGGQLRVGIGSASMFDLELGEAARDQHVAAAIDIVEAQGCTVSAGCNRGLAPAIAVLPATESSPSEALVLWQALTAPDAAACGKPEDFAIAAVRLPIEGEGSNARFARPVEEVSTLLRERGASGAPRVVAVGADDDAGFLVAFPTEDHIELAFIRRSSATSSAELVSIAARIAAPGASDLALAAGDELGLAIAYRSGAASKRVIKLREIELDRSGAGSISEVGAPVTLQSGAAIDAGPTIVFADDGFVVPVSDEPSGGWLIAHVELAPSGNEERTHLMINRVAQAGHRRIGEPLLLASGDIKHPFTYLKHEKAHSTLQCAFIESEALHVRRASW